MKQIRDTIGKPSEWKTNGGDISSMLELDGNLIIKTSAINHDAIEKLIASLRGEEATEQSETEQTEADQSDTETFDPLQPLKGTLWDKQSGADR